MRVTYDKRTDSLTFLLRSRPEVAESHEDKPGVVLDYDREGNLVAVEILDASRRVTDAAKVDFETVG